MPTDAHTRLLRDMYDNPFLYGLRYDRSKDKPDLIFLDKAYRQLLTSTSDRRTFLLLDEPIDRNQAKEVIEKWGWVAVSREGQLVTKRDSTARLYKEQLLDALLDLYGDPELTKTNPFA